MIGPYQSEDWAAFQESNGLSVIKIQNTFIYVKHTAIGDIVSLEYPNDAPYGLLVSLPVQCPHLSQIITRIFNDAEYSKTRLTRSIQKYSHKVDLTYPLDVLWERLSRGNRKHINQAQEKKVCVKSENTDLAFNKFWSVYSNLAQKKNFHILQRTVMRRVSQLAIASLYVAYVHERPAAVAIVLHSDSVARYWYGAGDPDYYSYRPSNLLHWQVMVDMKNAGCSVYDLGGSSPTNTFKAGFGARLCEQEKAEYRTLKGEMLARIPQRLIPVLKKVTG